MDIKESKELLVACNEIAIVLIKQLKDGFQPADASELLSKIMLDEELKSKLLEAYLGMSKIKDELKDVQLAEGIELAMLQVQYVPKIIEAMKA